MTECNVKNRTIFCDDNLDILQGINSECIDLIYLDPPFNKNKKFTAPIGTSAEGASFKDIFTQDDLKEEWLKTLEENQSDLFRYLSGIRGIGKPYNFAYLAYMAIRLLECRRVLKSTGSIYLHCDPTMSHYLKTTMDCIFGEENFRNEIVWGYTGPSNTKRYFPRKHDIVLLYSKGDRWIFNADAVRIGYSRAFLERRKYTEGDSGITSGYSEGRTSKEVADKYSKGKLPEDYWTDIGGGGAHIKRRTHRLSHPKAAGLAPAHHPGLQQRGGYCS